MTARMNKLIASGMAYIVASYAYTIAFTNSLTDCPPELIISPYRLTTPLWFFAHITLVLFCTMINYGGHGSWDHHDTVSIIPCLIAFIVTYAIIRMIQAWCQKRRGIVK
jgi:hypothetical protein